MSDNKGNPTDFMSIQMGSNGRPVGALFGTIFIKDGSMIMIDSTGQYWQAQIVINDDGVTAAIQLQRITI